MTKQNELDEAKADISQSWGSKIVTACEGKEPLCMSFNEFLDDCIACGGDWGGMLLSGVKKLRPEIWDMIPDNMGHNAWIHICNLLVLLGVSLPE